MLLKLQVLLLDLVHSDAYHIDHVSEDGSAHYLDHGDHDGLDEVVGSEIAVAHRHHCCIGPVERVDVVDVPRPLLELGFLKPVLTATGAEVNHSIHDQRLY
jgi:hypothetical protein